MFLPLSQEGGNFAYQWDETGRPSEAYLRREAFHRPLEDPPRCVVLVPLDAVNCTKVDGGNLAGVVVSINKAKSSCRVAVQQGLLHRAYVYHVLKPIPESSNNLDVMNLREANEDWRSLPKITQREAAHFISSVG
jgi:hypothetical protein